MTRWTWRSAAIVAVCCMLHGAAYVSPHVVQRFGQLGRSWGCPAVDPAVLSPLVQRIKDGTALFAYYPDPRWLRQSRFLQCDARG